MRSNTLGKLLDIVITHWTEPWEIGANAFRMLSVQRRVNWDKVGVSIIHDGSDAFPDENFYGFPFRVKQYCIPHGGISAARNYAIEHCDAEWIKFCDFDDMFAGAYSLSCIIDAVSFADGYDLLWFPMIVDVFGGGLDIKDGSPVFIHDKVFRLSFLRNNNVMFNPDLTYSEDFAFISLTKLKMDRNRVGKIESNFPLYVFVQREDSVSNCPSNWFANRICHFNALRYVEEIVRDQGEKREADAMVVRVMVECYYTITNFKAHESVNEFTLHVWDYFDSHKNDFYAVSSDDIKYIISYTNQQYQSDITKAEFMRWIHTHETGGR